MKPDDALHWLAAHDATVLTIDPALPKLPAAIDRCEMVWVQALDAADRPRGPLVRVAQGGASKVHVNLPAILAVPLAAGCDRFVLVHNHPNHTLDVSREDKELTRRTMLAAVACGLTLVDHVIVSPQAGTLSFVDQNILERAPRIVEVIASQSR